jgi:MarR family transcriptional regulator for hemolysin
MDSSPDDAARHILEVVPLVMRAIRSEMRSHRAADLSVPQFRTLGFIDRRPGASLSNVAEHIGLTLPSASKLVDGLVSCGLATRREHADDRRRVVLGLTAAGCSALAAARKATRLRLAARLAAVPRSDRSVIAQAMAVLQRAFSSERQAQRADRTR